jgi:hypothetical protein
MSGPRPTWGCWPRSAYANFRDREIGPWLTERTLPRFTAWRRYAGALCRASLQMPG